MTFVTYFNATIIFKAAGWVKRKGKWICFDCANKQEAPCNGKWEDGGITPTK